MFFANSRYFVESIHFLFRPSSDFCRSVFATDSFTSKDREVEVELKSGNSNGRHENKGKQIK